MGTKVQCESYFPGYFSMRDLNEDCNSCSWPPYYGDKTLTSGQYYGGLFPKSNADAYPGYDKDVVKRTMLEHEAIFKNQLYELHRLYRTQRDLMDEFKWKELRQNRIPVETTFSSSPLASSQIASDDARKWHILGFPLASSVCARPSTSGIEDAHSPLSSMRGSSARASPLSSQNGGILKDAKMPDSRPSKVRRKMFDLHLPANEYIDTEEGEQLGTENVSGISSHLPNGDHMIVPETGMSSLLGNGGKNNCQGNSSQSTLCLRRTNNMADLNEPIEYEEVGTPSRVNCLGSTSSDKKIKVHELAANLKSQVLGFPKDMPLNTHHEGANGDLEILHSQNSANRKQWLPHMLDAGRTVSQGLHPERLPASSPPILTLFDKTHEPSALFLVDQSKAYLLREATVHGIGFSKKNKEISNINRPDSVVTSHHSSSYPYALDLRKSKSHTLSSWEKHSDSISQKSSVVQMHSYVNSSATLSRSSQSSIQAHGICGDRWNYNSNSASNPSLGIEIANQNGFYYGSSSGTKEPLVIHLPSDNRGHLNCSSANNMTSDHFTNHRSVQFGKGSNCVGSKSAEAVNLNVVLSNSLSNNAAPRQGISVIDLERKHDDHPVALPWLRAKPACENETSNLGMDLNTGDSDFLQSSLSQLTNESKKGESPNKIAICDMKSVPRADVEVRRTEVSDSSGCRKILGFPIFEKEHIVKIESSSLTSPSMSLPHPLESEVKNNMRNRVLDINLPCDVEVLEFGQHTAAEVEPDVANPRPLFDLNSYVSEDEASLMPSVPGSNVKIIAGIDLEAPVVPETEGDAVRAEECLKKMQETPLQLPEPNAENPPNELVRVAAEAMVAISLSCHQNHVDEATSNQSEASVSDPLRWFVEIVSSCGEDLESKFDTVSGAKYGKNNESSLEEIDYFESMTLLLIETKEEDYMPKPLVPENLKIEETGTTTLVPTRTRRGQARRGRQRRDFQRDILPGLASLSRHEVTEDLQIFGGLMRAMGHTWHSGPTRRNAMRTGYTRGRRPRSLVSPTPGMTQSLPCTLLTQQLKTIKVGLEDRRRSLTGWGKTTRRPRRQRCPAGNPPPPIPA